MHSKLILKMSASPSHTLYDEACSVNTNTDDDQTENTDAPHPVLLNPLIVERVFEYLALRTLKKCRLVCLHWKSVGDASFKKKYRICFNFEDNPADKKWKTCKTDSELKYPANLKEFFIISQSEHPFTAIGFEKVLPWLPADLTDFFSSEGRFITDLKLTNVGLKAKSKVGKNVKILTGYDLTALLSGIENLKKLTIARDIIFHKNSSTPFLIRWTHLTRLQHINLERCTLVLDKQSLLLSPVELHLRHVMFTRGNQIVKKILINEIVNLDIVEKLSLDNIMPIDHSYSELSLDLGGNTVLKEVYLQGVEVANFFESCCTINSLRLTYYPFDKKSSMVIKELNVWGASCALKCLPSSLEKLCLEFEAIIAENCSTEVELWNISLPNVTQLELDNIAFLENCIPNLIPCFCNLESLRISSIDKLSIDVILIPPTVKVLTLEGNITFLGYGRLALQELCFTDGLYLNTSSVTISVLQNLSYFTPKFFRLSKVKMNSKDPNIHALIHTSIPRVELKTFASKQLRKLRRRYSFDRIDKDNELGVIVNDRGSTITMLYTSK